MEKKYKINRSTLKMRLLNRSVNKVQVVNYFYFFIGQNSSPEAPVVEVNLSIFTFVIIWFSHKHQAGGNGTI